MEGILYLRVRLTTLLQQRDSVFRHTDQGNRRSAQRETPHARSAEGDKGAKACHCRGTVCATHGAGATEHSRENPGTWVESSCFHKKYFTEGQGSACRSQKTLRRQGRRKRRGPRARWGGRRPKASSHRKCLTAQPADGPWGRAPVRGPPRHVGCHTPREPISDSVSCKPPSSRANVSVKKHQPGLTWSLRPTRRPPAPPRDAASSRRRTCPAPRRPRSRFSSGESGQGHSSVRAKGERASEAKQRHRARRPSVLGVENPPHAGAGPCPSPGCCPALLARPRPAHWSFASQHVLWDFVFCLFLQF